jgi:hypothetical protein
MHACSRLEMRRGLFGLLELCNDKVDLMPPTVLDVYAACASCGATIEDWRARLFPLAHARLVVTQRCELALWTSAFRACSVCEGSVAEIRIEEHGPRSRTRMIASKA